MYFGMWIFNLQENQAIKWLKRLTKIVITYGDQSFHKKYSATKEHKYYRIAFQDKHYFCLQ